MFARENFCRIEEELLCIYFTPIYENKSVRKLIVCTNNVSVHRSRCTLNAFPSRAARYNV